MRIFVDADACPVSKIVEEIAKNREIDLFFVCDTSHILHSEYGKVIVVSKGMDSVDFYIVNRVKKNDIVVTGDYGVAAMSLAKGCHPIQASGKYYTNDNMDQMLYERHMAKVARRSSRKYHSSGHKKRKKEDDIAFRQSLIKLIESIRV